jgi:TIR domain/Pentapeptide repeats (9 copies)
MAQFYMRERTYDGFSGSRLRLQSRIVKKSQTTDWATKTADDAPDFRGGNLAGEVFARLDLHQRDFRRAVLRKAEFVECELTGANFADADLSDANFRGAKCLDVDFSNANLSRANFYQANLSGASFVGANVFSTNFRESQMGQTVFANLDMETCIGLDSVKHSTHSSVAIECLYRFGSNLPLLFLKGVGLPQILLDYLPSLIEVGSPIQFHSCFISYSHTDEVFARRLWNGMRNERIRVWYAPEEMKAGKKLFEQIDRAINMHDKLLVVLSKESISSNWVQTEIRRARKQEKRASERKLFPIRLCEMDTLKAWECFDADSGQDIAEEIREYFIPDFSEWRNPEMFKGEFIKLCRDLRREGVPMRKEEEDSKEIGLAHDLAELKRAMKRQGRGK